MQSSIKCIIFSPKRYNYERSHHRSNHFFPFLTSVGFPLRTKFTQQVHSTISPSHAFTDHHSRSCSTQPWSSSNLPTGYWKNVENQKTFLNWAATQLKINNYDDWYKVPSLVHKLSLCLNKNT